MILGNSNGLVVEEKYETIIGKFMETKQTTLAFPSTLTAFERRTVHEISEKLGLIHISSGEGAGRYVEIKKPANDSTASVSECSSGLIHISSGEGAGRYVEIRKPANDSTASVSEYSRSTEISASADVENEVTSETETPSDAQPETAQVREMKPKRSVHKKKGKKVVQQQNAESTTQEEDFDTLIEQAVKADKTCSFEKCRKCVAVLSQVCQFCRGRFCFGHFIPEAHGCGPAAKAHARSQIRKEGVLHPGSGRPVKKVDPARHSQLQRRLDKKLDDMSRQRKAKPKS